MEEFLTANGYSQDVVAKFSIQNLDLSKLCELTDEDLEDACEGCNLSLSQFRKLRGLLKEKKSESVAVVPNVQEPVVYPKELKSLIRPNAFTDSFAVDNFVLEEICRCAWGNICLVQFKEYVTSMRICWGDIRAIPNSIRDTVEALFSNESTGYAENIRRYQKEDVHLGAADGLKLDNIIKHVKLVVAKISPQLNDLTKR